MGVRKDAQCLQHLGRVQCHYGIMPLALAGGACSALRHDMALIALQQAMLPCQSVASTYNCGPVYPKSFEWYASLRVARTGQCSLWCRAA